MDFELDDVQHALVDTVASFCADRFDITTVRALAETGGINRRAWGELAGMGMFSLPLPEADGGVGMGWIDTALVFEQLGRALVPGPLVAAALAARVVDGVAEGEVIPTVVQRRANGDAMPYARAVDVVLVLDDAGVWQLNPGSLGLDAHDRPLDPLTPVASAPGDLPQGDQVAGPEVALLWQTRGAVLTAALQLGLSAAATELAVAYAKERQQFGQPIGSFQAVKHMCADMLTQVEVARASVYQAGALLDDVGPDEAAHHAATAAIVASEAADFCGRTCIQVHGGMGYTWEVDSHLFLKRAWVLDHGFASRAEHADAIAASL